MSGQRNVLNTPHPIYGITAGGFGVGDLPPAYTSETPILAAIAANTVSNPVQLNANSGIQLNVTFSDGSTSCDVTVLRADAGGDTLVGVYHGVNNLKGDLYFGYYDQRVMINGIPIKVQISNYQGAGTVTVTGCRTS